VRLSVRTEELRGAGEALSRAQDQVARLTAGVDRQRAGVRTWAVDRGTTQADAFLATLLEGVAGAADDLGTLALATSVAAQDYDDAESAALPRPR